MPNGRWARVGILDALVNWTTLVLIAGFLAGTNGSLSKRRVVKVDGDILIGALFPVHRQPSQKTAYTRQCGEIWEQYGMHRIEVFLKTIDEINADDSILPNVTLGCDIRDSCWYPPVALEQSIDFIKNSIASREAVLNRNNKIKSAPPVSGPTPNKPIAGLIGPGSSTVTIQVQNLLSLFNIPQVGYSATSKDLSNKSLYKYFLRVVPSDKLQAKALVDLVLYYNWTYISTVYTAGNYGFSGIEEFHAMAEEAGLCTAAEEKVENNADDASYDLIIESLLETPTAKVVVCFCEGMTVNGLLKATKRKGAQGQFLFIGSDGWAVRPDVVDGIEDISIGGISFKLYSPPIMDFDDYYYSLNPYNNTRNPWFREFWQQKFQCQLEGIDADPSYTKPCTGDEDLSFEYVQDAKLGFVVNAIYTMANALDNMRRELCADTEGMCSYLDPVNGSLFLDYLLNVSFTSYSHDKLHFNHNGDPPGRYDIMNFQRIDNDNGTKSYEYVRIGGWDNGNLTMDNSKIFWPNKKALSGAPMIESVCSQPCPRGQVKVPQDRAHCCWVCTQCKENEFMLDESHCKACPMGWLPNENLTACLMIDIEYMQWNDTEAVVSITFACVGIVATMWVTMVFVRHNNTPVVKASTRELSYIILLGITISYTTTFPLVAKPSLVTCYLTRILPGWSFAMIYGALVTKTNRIARILAGSKKKIMTRKPRFMSASAQVVITCIIIGVECAIITVMLILEPADSKLIFPTETRVELTCNATKMGIIVPLGFDIFLIVMCTLYAIKTRNLPENFNEAKFIGFTMYTTCIIWLAFVPIYFGSDSKVITMCLTITLSATVALILLFFPKIYIMICKPERNNRSAFTTSKEVRCHIGSTGGRSMSTDSFDRLELLWPSTTEQEDSKFIDNLLGNLSPVSDEDLRLKTKSTISLFTSWKTGNLDQHHHVQVKGTVHHPPRMSPTPDMSDDNRTAPKHKAWHEKSFEHAAMAMYRQKSFFSRWRDKSNSNVQGASRARPRPGTTGSGNRVGSRAGAKADDLKTCNHDSNQRKLPSENRANSTNRQQPKQNNASSASKSDESVRRNPSLRSIGFQKHLSVAYTDSSVQTDIELAESLVSNLKHRKPSTRSNHSRNEDHRCNIVVVEPHDVHTENGKCHNQKRTPRDDSLPSYTSCLPDPAEVHDQEMDSLLKGSDNYLDFDTQNSSQAYSFQSPFLPGSERSPLLGSEGYLCDDTTSEETLSEQGDSGEHDDLDELLLGAGEYQGSFSSVASSNSNPRWNPSSKRSSSDSSAHVQILPDKAFFGFRNRPQDSRLSQKEIKPATRTKNFSFYKPPKVDTSDVFDLESGRTKPDAASVPTSDFTYEPRKRHSPPVEGAASNSSTAVPRIMVKRATPQTSSSERFSEITGSNSSFRTDFSGLGSSVGDSGHPMTVTPDSRRTSATESSTSSNSSADRICSGLSSSVEEFTPLGITKDDSVTKFQEYLRTRGVDLDLSTVQSSDV